MVGPTRAPLVTVEWLDIASSISEPGLVRRWTDGRLLAVDHESEGVPCVLLGATWDEGGWSDYSTFPASVVVNLDDLRQALIAAGLT